MSLAAAEDSRSQVTPEKRKNNVLFFVYGILHLGEKHPSDCSRRTSVSTNSVLSHLKFDVRDRYSILLHFNIGLLRQTFDQLSNI